MNGEKSLRVCGEESPGDEYTFSLVSDLCPQGPCSGLDSEGRTPYKEDLHPLQPRSQLCQTKWGRGPVQGLRLGQGGNTPSPDHHRPTEHRACRAQSGCPGRPSPCLACTAPAWMAAPLQPAWEDSSRTSSACARSSSVNHKVCSELLEWASSESYIGHTLSWTSKQGLAKAPARSPCGHHA